jgi:hypothetical protein
MQPINPKDRRIANIHEATFKPFVYPDGVALGDAVLQLDDDKELGTGFHVYRMPPGMTTRSHRHDGHEQFLILEGELHESDGTVLKAGDMVFYRDYSDEVTAPRRHRCAKVGLQGSTKEDGHVGDYHGRARPGEECVYRLWRLFDPGARG